MSNILSNGELDLFLNKPQYIHGGNNQNENAPNQNKTENPTLGLSDTSPIATIESEAAPVVESTATDVEATSDLDTEEKNVANKISNLPVEITSKMYHIVLDCDYGEFVDDLRRQSRAATVFGKIGNKLSSDRIPVLYSKPDAVNVARKLITKVVNKGSIGNGKNKKFPFLGAVIMGIQFNTNSLNNISYNKVNSYDDINNENKQDLISWEKNGQTRAAILKSSLVHTKVVDAEYVIRTGLNVNNGLALLNLVPELSVEDVSVLKCLLDGQKGDCFITNKNNKNIEEVEVESRGEVQLGGKYDTNFRDLSIREKAMYVVNKNKKQMGGNLNVQNSFANNAENFVDIEHASDDSAYWKPLYKNAKRDYLMKKQSGGADIEEYYKQQYIQKKKEYLKLKAQKQMNGGNLNEIDMDHATDDDTYWKPLYLQKKAEYITRKGQ